MPKAGISSIETLVNSSGQVPVSVDAGSLGASSADGATHTPNTTTGTPTQGVYEATPTTIADNDLGTIAIDANRNVKVNPATLLAGEDLTNNRLMTRPTYSYSAVAVADVQVKGSAGYLHTITISCNDAAPTAGSIIVYDSLSETGTQVFNHTFTTTPFVPFSVVLDYTMATGIYVGFTTTADVNVSCAYL